MEGVKVYVPDADHVWLPGVITQSKANQNNVTVRLVPIIGPRDTTIGSIPTEKEFAGLVGKERVIDFTDPQVIKALSSSHTTVSNQEGNHEELGEKSPKKPLSLPLQNVFNGGNVSTGYEDMITIDHLHEASILYNLRHRFFHKLPYTYTGKICIAVNPYQWLNLYDPSMMATFKSGTREDKPPHVYAISMEAFHHMRRHQENQSILVSGESGAGKTETTKIIMNHLATLAENSNSIVIQQIIQANPLLESFGNAKTVRNHNSSRFGKFTELEFNCINGQLIGAFSRTYLLEKSRVTKQSEGECNFHIFYQLLQASTQYPTFELETPFRYVSTSTIQEEHGNLQQTCDALALIGISSVLQQEMLSVLAGILHLGQVTFTTKNEDVDTSTVVSQTSLLTACRLLGVEMVALEQALCFRNVHVGREVILKPMTQEQATDCRDALAKSLYSTLFHWLVTQINQTIGNTSINTTSSIGILDIFGFEQFKTNSFEQFCINYANETLQQKFVQDVLKTVQIEYEEESITWSHVTFIDNQAVLDLIEGHLGIISLLNEESLLATGNGQAFVNKLGAVMENNSLLTIPRLYSCAFTISHYAGDVTYDALGFVEKHRDAILPDIKQVMSTSTLSLLSTTYTVEKSLVRTLSRKRIQPNPKRTTVGTQFKESLSELMDKIHSTHVHYIRCIKPNSFKTPDSFSHQEIVNQLRCAGVIEAIRVSRSMYSSRMSHTECLSKFSLLNKTKRVFKRLKEEEENDYVRLQCELLLNSLLPNGSLHEYQVGTTRIYFCNGILEKLETMRAQTLRQYAIILQKTIRMFIVRRRFLRLKHATIQIQTYWRGYVLYKRFIRFKQTIITIQAHFRGQQARFRFKAIKIDYYLIRFQAICRCFLIQRQYQKQRKAVITIQHFWRFTLVRMVFIKKMIQEQKNKALSSKVALLQQKLDQKGQSTSQTSSMIEPRHSSIRYSSTGTILDESQEVITTLHEENEKLRLQSENLEKEIVKYKLEIRTLREWQTSKQVDEKVQKIVHRDQETKDLSYLYALETEYEKLRTFICEQMNLPVDTGTIISSPDVSTPPTSSNSSRTLVSPSNERTEFVNEVQYMLQKSATRLHHIKTKTNTKGNTRRVKDHWEEIRHFPPPMQYTLGSIPWKRLLTDWAQGNPKKLDYMTRWLKNVLEGGPIVSDTFPMGVELKYVTPMMLDGFMQLVIPKLAERADIQVHVHTKEFIGTSMRITLSPVEGLTTPPSASNEEYRVSLLVSQQSNGGTSTSTYPTGRFSTASTSSVSSDGSTITTHTNGEKEKAHRPSIGFFRSGRHTHRK